MDGSLTEDARLDQHTFSLVQYGRIEVAILLFLLGVFLVLSAVLSATAAAGVVMAVFAAGLLLWERAVPLRATLSLTDGAVTVRGILGRVPIRRRAVFSLAEVQVSVEEGPMLLGRPSWRLVLSGAGESARLLGLIGSAGELARVEAVLSAAAARASARQGAGAAEVPAALRQRIEQT